MATTELSTTTEEPTTEPPSDEVLLRHEELVNENAEVGVMFASKPIVQAITNPFVGPLTNKYITPFFVVKYQTLTFSFDAELAILGLYFQA